MKARDYIEIHGFIACAMGACLIYNTLASCNQGRIKQIKGGVQRYNPIQILHRELLKQESKKRMSKCFVK